MPYSVVAAKILLLILILPVSGFSASASFGADAEVTLKKLRAVSSQDPYYSESLFESSRIYYQLNRWPEFFGLTGYLRQVFPQTEVAEKARILESMGLIRHCQFKRAEARISSEETKLNRPLDPQWATSRQLLRHWVRALPHAKVAKSTPEDPTGKPKIFVEAIEWPVSVQGKELLSFNPYELRRRVESLCPGVETP